MFKFFAYFTDSHLTPFSLPIKRKICLELKTTNEVPREFIELLVMMMRRIMPIMLMMMIIIMTMMRRMMMMKMMIMMMMR